MDDTQDWLPDLIDFNKFGNWGVYLEVIYDQFQSDFVHSRPSWPGKRFSLKRHPEYDGKSATFWHMISEGRIEDERTPDLRRCERIAWLRPIIDRFPGQRPAEGGTIVWWVNSRRGEQRILMTLRDFSYVVVMADRGDYIMPWTAYPVEYSHRQRKLERECEAYWKTQDPEKS